MFSTKVTGIKEVDKVLTKITPKHAKNIMRATVHDVARELAADARSKAPRSPGAGTRGKHFSTASVIKHKRDRGERGRVSSSVRVFGPWSNFWKMLENGTVKTPEHAMFAKAVEYMRGRMEAVFIASFKKKLDAAVKRELKKAG